MNEVDSHNKSRQSDLALEKWWVNQCGCLRLCTTVAMGMTITNCWKLFRYGVKRDNYEKNSASENSRKDLLKIASTISSHLLGSLYQMRTYC